jgi:prepilin-type processing-associated H-X9-DG protein
MTVSMSRMRQIGEFQGMYARDNREHIIPSQFDYSSDVFTYKGKVRTGLGADALGTEHMGTWTDIIWTVFEMGTDLPGRGGEPSVYRYDSPDQQFFKDRPSWGEITFRSAAPNSRNATQPSNPEPRPFGDGAEQIGEPGFFAANDFFSAVPQSLGDVGTWYVTGQIRSPERSMYLVDSVAGEVIPCDDEDPTCPSYDFTPPANPDEQPPGEVDFRYSDNCLMLFLDGHVEPQGRFDQLTDLEGIPGNPNEPGRGIRVRALDQRTPP